jgi:hypothetical protein
MIGSYQNVDAAVQNGPRVSKVASDACSNEISGEARCLRALKLIILGQCIKGLIRLFKLIN